MFRRFVVAMVALATFLGPLSAAPVSAESDLLLWSDPATWGGSVPVDDDAVTIPKGKRVLLDVSPPPLASLMINGELIFDDQDLFLETDWILVHGLLQIGSEDEPFQSRATIQLIDRHPDEDIHGMGDKLIGVMNGRIVIHGEDRGPSWTRLAETAHAGDDTIRLEESTDWRPGDSLVVASTDFDQYQAEWVTVSDVDGEEIQLEEPLAVMHWGEEQEYGDRVVSERAEVGLLTRNIQIQGDEASDETGFGGHLMVMGGTAQIEGATFFRMGQAGKLARYPIHFHLLGDRPDAVVRDTAIVHSYNRCLTVHGTNDVLIERVVAVETRGHCFFMEDGIETGNRFIDNLGLLTMPPDEEHQLLPTDSQAATFWITNPDNTFTGNVAAGSDAFGFWLALPENPTGLSATDETTATVWPRRTPLRQFADNVAHSNGSRGLQVDDGPNADGEQETTIYEPRVNPIPPAEGEDDSALVTAVFENFVAYKNRDHGVWMRGVDHELRGAILADNGIGATFASYESYLTDSLVVGETENIGTPYDGETTGVDGRTLPFPWEPSFPIRGYQFYDGVVGAKDVEFAGFFSNEQRQASGLGFLIDDEFSLDPRNSISGATWLDDSNRVYVLPPYTAGDGSKTSVFQDVDGSVTDRPGSFVVANNGFVKTSSCSGVPEWNGFVCELDYTMIGFEDFSGREDGLGMITLRRGDGQRVNLIGAPADEPYPRTSFYASLITNHVYTVTPARQPAYLRIGIGESAPGTTVVLEFSTYERRPFIYGAYDWSEDGSLTRVMNKQAVLDGDGSLFFFDPLTRTLVVKLLVAEGDVDATIDICVTEGCA